MPLEQQIVSILDEYIKPAVASDGGNIVFDSYDAQLRKSSTREYYKAPAAVVLHQLLHLKTGIETMLKEMMPGKVATCSCSKRLSLYFFAEESFESPSR